MPVFNGPITSGVLGTVDKLNISASYFAPAGSGPGPSPSTIGPNPSVSTLSFPTAGAINMDSLLTINDPGTAVVEDFQFATNDTNAPLAPYMSSIMNDFIVNGPGGDGANGQLLMLSGPDGRAAIWCNNAIGLNSTLSIVADNVIMPQNLQVSSINGAVPGAISTFNAASVSSLSVSSINGVVPGTVVSSFATASISSLTLSTVNGAQLPIAQGDGYNVAPWQASGIIVGSQGIFSGVLNLGGNISGGGFTSTFQLPQFIEFANTNNMTGNVVSGALASGALNDVAIQFPNTSSMAITATVAGNIGTLFVSVQGSANGFL